MPAPESILNKVKLLLNLANSPNPNEAGNAKVMADKLISKYEITEEELESIKDKPSPYGDDNKLFVTLGLNSWRQQLALAIAKYFYCKIVQEVLVPIQGVEQYNYYVFGEPEDIENVKIAYQGLSKKVDEVISAKCIGRGPVYVASYTEGLVEAIANNIHWQGIDLPGIKAPNESSEQEGEISETKTIVKQVEEVKTPTEESVNVTSQRDLIKDIGAYFNGLHDGKNLSFRDVFELEEENEEAKQLS